MITPSHPLIMDTGTSVCISPNKDDFIEATYRPSSLKIKDLSSSNKVLGEGMICWSVLDKHGLVVMIEIPGYHIAKAEVHLHSLQVLLGLSGGQSVQTISNISLNLDNGVELVTTYCSCSQLPILPMSSSTITCNLWSDAFVYADRTSSVYVNVLGQLNTNLSVA